MSMAYAPILITTSLTASALAAARALAQEAADSVDLKALDLAASEAGTEPNRFRSTRCRKFGSRPRPLLLNLDVHPALRSR